MGIIIFVIVLVVFYVSVLVCMFETSPDGSTTFVAGGFTLYMLVSGLALYIALQPDELYTQKNEVIQECEDYLVEINAPRNQECVIEMKAVIKEKIDE